MVRSGLKKILVVDDDPFIRSLLSAWLQEAGYETVTASDGQQALEQVVREKPDILLLDLMMPKLDGYSVVKWLRRHEETSGLPIIILSADVRAHHKLSGVRIDDLISKPFDLDEVLLRVTKHVPLNGNGSRNGDGVSHNKIRVETQPVVSRVATSLAASKRAS
jgi:diguanylate cyclase